jgi:hypothetical protein
MQGSHEICFNYFHENLALKIHGASMLVRFCGLSEFSVFLAWPYRRQASSHKSYAGFESCVVPVGAGLPAIGL